MLCLAGCVTTVLLSVTQLYSVECGLIDGQLEGSWKDAVMVDVRFQASAAKYRGADKSLARPGRKQARKHVRDTRHITNIEKRAVKFFFLQGKAPKEIDAILTETLACFLPGRVKDLSAPLYYFPLIRS